VRKAATPETTRQARTWDVNFNAYKDAGFCPPCASQAAWGHQIGFSLANRVGNCCRGKSTPKGLERAERWANAEPEPAEQ
jgi:hypothetical protein